jgi:hypothetical protein
VYMYMYISIYALTSHEQGSTIHSLPQAGGLNILALSLPNYRRAPRTKAATRFANLQASI